MNRYVQLLYPIANFFELGTTPSKANSKVKDLIVANSLARKVELFILTDSPPRNATPLADSLSKKAEVKAL